MNPKTRQPWIEKEGRERRIAHRKTDRRKVFFYIMQINSKKQQQTFKMF